MLSLNRMDNMEPTPTSGADVEGAEAAAASERGRILTTKLRAALARHDEKKVKEGERQRGSSSVVQEERTEKKTEVSDLISERSCEIVPDISRKTPENMVQPPCSVCHSQAHPAPTLGVCNPCRRFFRRAIANPCVPLCKNNYQCTIAHPNPNMCKACRLEKCLRTKLAGSPDSSAEGEKRVRDLNDQIRRGVTQLNSSMSPKTYSVTQSLVSGPPKTLQGIHAYTHTPQQKHAQMTSINLRTTHMTQKLWDGILGPHKFRSDPQMCHLCVKQFPNALNLRSHYRFKHLRPPRAMDPPPLDSIKGSKLY